MPPPSDSVPRTPDRRSSSSALFGAFRNLTGGILKSSTPPTASLSSVTGTPAHTPSIRSDQRPESIAGVAAASPDANVKTPDSDVAVDFGKAHGKVHGGPPELETLVQQLHPSTLLAERVRVVDKICAILNEYPVRNVLPLWDAGSDLLAKHQPLEAVQAGFTLLKSCTALDHLTPLERNVFFKAAALRDDEHFDLRLQVMVSLTQDGRNIEAFEPLLASFVLAALEPCFKQSREARKSHAKTSVDQLAQEGQPRKSQGKTSVDPLGQDSKTIARMFQYAINVTKFNSKIFCEDDLEVLLASVMRICEKTDQRRDIEYSIKLFDTIITYVYVPPSSLQPCLEVLCAVHRLKGLKDQTWNTLSNLFKSHVGQAAVSALLRTLRKGPLQESFRDNKLRGSIDILEKLLLEDGQNGLPQVPVSLLVPALKSSILLENQGQEEYVLGLVEKILAEEKLRSLLLSEADWTDLIHIIRICAEREDRRKAPKEKPACAETLSTAGSAALAHGDSSNASVVSATEDQDANSVINVAKSTRPRRSRRTSSDTFSNILISLDAISHEMDYYKKAFVMELFMHLATRLSDSTAENMMTFHVDEGYFQPSTEDFLESCAGLVYGIIADETRPRSLRIKSIRVLRNTYTTIDGLRPDDEVQRCAALLLDTIEMEEDVIVLHELVDFAVEVADRASYAAFPQTISLLKKRLEHSRDIYSPPPTISPPWMPTSPATVDQPLGSPCNVITTAFVRLFTRSVTKSARKTLCLYDMLREIVGSEACESDARLTAMKLLFRLRAESNHSLTVSASSEGESIAGVLHRTTETAVVSDKMDEAGPVESGRPDDYTSWRDQRKVSGGSPHSSLNRHTGRNNNGTSRVSKPISPLWMYPGPKGLPEEPSPIPSRVVYAHIDAAEYPLSDDLLDLQVTLWLELVISLLQKAPDWEIYSYVLVHLGPQLSNQALVRSCVPQLKMLRSVVCEQIRNSTFYEPPSVTLLKKADVAVCLFHILTVLISYHDYYEKSEEDELVKVFLHGIGSWDRTAKWCIHALTVCCHEMPLSVSKSLDNIIQKMSQIITKPSTAIHILEFLTSMARMPELYKNFRVDEFKMVFGVSFRYLQHVRDQRERANVATSSQGGNRTLRQSGYGRDLVTHGEHTSARSSRAAVDDVPQYVYSLAYHVITFWFMCLKMEDRAKQIPWITENLRYTDSTGRQVMEEQGQVLVDLMNMVAYSDRDETVYDPNFAKESDGQQWTRTWIVGHSLLTIRTAARTGMSIVTSRRPCGTRYHALHPLLAPPPAHQVPLTTGLAAEAFHTSSYVGILPEDIFQTYYAPLGLADPPVLLPDDEATRRAITLFDHNATVDGHKVGVIYIGEGQTQERDILNNDIGSSAYTSFLNDLGTLVKLKDAKCNTGGLDIRGDNDGEFTFCWRDRCIELVFHIPTMMPTNADDESTYWNKKKHIGNDYVNIIFNDSGLPYNFDTFPSAFNYVYIVITPESRASFVDRRLDADPDGKTRYFKVQVIPKPGFPDISPAAEPKIISGKHLAAYCRLIAINACVFSQVWSKREGGEAVSSWRNRLREINRLRARYGAGGSNSALAPAGSHNVAVGAGTVGLGAERAKNESSSAFKRTSIATYVSEGSRSSVTNGSQHDVAL
ncbi:hypothetical protein BCR34DRAFT_605193 [Clohesyomyces aquaticus]|uniref:Rap-GAP domain-containing protein n=1 Tax=Clohesyomyces aquaticus TaxID=1231657 RepID=A0A1Y1Z060_9PLEO|nr:hypothetical protein BCR34DRAFT_605193 [Clohesyomyces aquaticus]